MIMDLLQVGQTGNIGGVYGRCPRRFSPTSRGVIAMPDETVIAMTTPDEPAVEVVKPAEPAVEAPPAEEAPAVTAVPAEAAPAAEPKPE